MFSARLLLPHFIKLDRSVAQNVSRYVRTALVLAASLSFVCNGLSQATVNLAQQGWYADPEIHIFAGQYWIYPTSSSPDTDNKDKTFNPLQQQLRAGHVIHPVYLLHTSLDALSSPDLVHWTKHPDVLDVRNIAWAAYAIWAPTAIHLNGKYYLFFAANDIQKKDTFLGGIGVGVSAKPEGPFLDAIGKPLIGEFHNGAQPIDPFVMKDDDGTIYLYYGGQGHCNIARLAPDLKSVIPMKDGAMYKEITPEHYVEGPFVIKRKGIYYFMWSEGSWENETYGVAYAKSASPTGPFVRAGKILQTNPAIAKGPGHHSVLQIPGTDDWYIVYHYHPLDTTGANQRKLAIDRMTFDKDGNIEQVKLTKEGAGPRPLTK
jgi:beta-xylosidase